MWYKGGEGGYPCITDALRGTGGVPVFDLPIHSFQSFSTCNSPIEPKSYFDMLNQQLQLVKVTLNSFEKSITKENLTTYLHNTCNVVASTGVFLEVLIGEVRSTNFYGFHGKISYFFLAVFIVSIFHVHFSQFFQLLFVQFPCDGRQPILLAPKGVKSDKKDAILAVVGDDELITGL